MNIKMRQFIVVMVAFVSLLSSVAGQEVNNKQWTLIHERTADWCPFCGTWGWDLKTKISSTFADDNLIFMAVHHSGGLSNATALAIGNNFSGAGQPIFYMDGTDIDADSGNVNTKIQEIQSVLDFNTFLPAYAGVGLEAELSKTEENTLTVNAKVEFFDNVEGGDYYLGLYLLEDVVHMQASRTQNETHENVLRTSLLDNAFGQSLKQGAVVAGTTFDVTTSVKNITPERNKIKVVAIIWNKVNGKYLFFNANQTEVAIPASDEATIISQDNFTAFQSEGGNIIVDLNINQPLVTGSIQITDMTGKLVNTQNINSLSVGKHRINVNANVTPGIYLVSITEGSQITSKKIVMR